MTKAAKERSTREGLAESLEQEAATLAGVSEVMAEIAAGGNERANSIGLCADAVARSIERLSDAAAALRMR